MTMYGVLRPDGRWHDRGTLEPRLFTLAGARSSVGRPNIQAARDLIPDQKIVDRYNTAGRAWNPDRAALWKALGKVYKRLDSNAYWAMLEREGYKLVEFELVPKGSNKDA